MTDASATLSLAGNSLELVGASILVYEIVQDSREARKYLTRPKVVRIGTAKEFARVHPLTVRRDPPPPVEQRIESLEERVTQLQEAIEEAKERLRREREEDLSGLHERLIGHVNDWNRALESFLLGAATGSFRLRIIGVALVLVGIALSAASAAVSI